jgi:hypothetical protein
MGYTPEQWAIDSAYMRRHASRQVGQDGYETISANFAEWGDQSAQRRFIGAMESEVTSHVIRADMNDLPAFFHKTGFGLATGQLFLQFRNFGITATRAMLVRNIKANDARTYMTFLAAVVSGGLVYTLKQALRYEDTPEGRKKYKESMEWDTFMKGAWANSATGGITEPVDALLGLATGEGTSGYRFTPSGAALGGVPTGRTADAIFKAAGAAIQVGTGQRELTDGDKRALVDLSILGNHPVLKAGKQVLRLYND